MLPSVIDARHRGPVAVPSHVCDGPEVATRPGAESGACKPALSRRLCCILTRQPSSSNEHGYCPSTGPSSGARAGLQTPRLAPRRASLRGTSLNGTAASPILYVCLRLCCPALHHGWVLTRDRAISGISCRRARPSGRAWRGILTACETRSDPTARPHQALLCCP